MRINNFLKNRKGFSMIEVMIALAIITMGLLGMMSLAIQSIQVKDVNQKYLIASMLAQEGLELVRNIRDDNWVQGRDWVEGSGAGSATDILQTANANSFVISSDTINKEIDIDASINNIANASMYLNGNGFYDHDNSGNTTPYNRLITVTDNTPAYIIVIANVQWLDSKGIHEYKAETELYDWR